jgi:cyclic pyranopterin phosphate synthase
MPEEDYDFAPASQLMQSQEIASLAATFVQLGVKKIRLTGGEPLVRKDAKTIIESLAKLPVQLTLTTNGARLHEFIPLLKDAGVRSLNVSLDTLKADRFQLITRRDQFKTVYDNIHRLIDNGIYAKVNVVVMKDLNDDEIIDFVEWTRHTPVHVRFIEFMPFQGNRWTSNKVITWQQILQVVEQQYSFIKLKDDINDTTKKYIALGHAGTFAVISTMSAPFCGNCNRMRLTADGKLKNCLFSKEETDLLTALRNNQDVIPLIHSSIRAKAKELGGQFSADFGKIEAGAIQNRSMITIGG